VYRHEGYQIGVAYSNFISIVFIRRKSNRVGGIEFLSFCYARERRSGTCTKRIEYFFNL
jgi:hypothetical protein